MISHPTFFPALDYHLFLFLLYYNSQKRDGEKNQSFITPSYFLIFTLRAPTTQNLLYSMIIFSWWCYCCFFFIFILFCLNNDEVDFDTKWSENGKISFDVRATTKNPLKTIPSIEWIFIYSTLFLSQYNSQFSNIIQLSLHFTCHPITFV